MIGRFFRQSLKSSILIPPSRWRPAKEFVCIHEELDKKAVEESGAKLKTLGVKYGLPNEKLMGLLPYLNLDLNELRSVFVDSEYDNYISELKYNWQFSEFYNSRQSFNEFLEDIQIRYPDLTHYGRDHYSNRRKEALDILGDLFLEEAKLPDPATLKEKISKKKHKEPEPEHKQHPIEAKVNAYISKLKQNRELSKAWVSQVENSLKNIETQLIDDPEQITNLGLFQYYLLHCGAVQLHHYEVPIQIPKHFGEGTGLPVTSSTLETKSTELETALAKDIPLPEYLSDQKIIAQLEKGNTIPAMVQELSKEIRGSLHYVTLPWVDNKKIILEASVEKKSVICWSAFAGLFGAAFIYYLWQGDAHASTLVLLPILALGCSYRANMNKAKNALDYLVQINIHKDGKNVDLFLQKPCKPITKVEGVPISDFKVHRGNCKIPDMDVTFPQQKLKAPEDYSLSHMRYFGVGSESYFATYGKRSAHIPFDYQGNSSVIQKVFQGKEVSFT